MGLEQWKLRWQTREDDCDEEHDEGAGEESDLECGPGALLLSERGHSQPLHGPLPVAPLQLQRHRTLRLRDQSRDVRVGVEVGGLDMLRAVLGTQVYIQELRTNARTLGTVYWKFDEKIYT